VRGRLPIPFTAGQGINAKVDKQSVFCLFKPIQFTHLKHLTAFFTAHVHAVKRSHQNVLCKKLNNNTHNRNIGTDNITAHTVCITQVNLVKLIFFDNFRFATKTAIKAPSAAYPTMMPNGINLGYLLIPPNILDNSTSTKQQSPKPKITA
jgi:hypothetical protein